MTARKPDPELPQQISYSVAQAHAATWISEWSLRKLVRDGHLAARYMGSTVLIDAADLARYVRSLPSERVAERDCAANRGIA